ncbi:MAG: Asp-tRNA(Asn)/Glu-tRNA(Gln) amidotransferase subunit GatB [Oscillospiraceae bacterium]
MKYNVTIGIETHIELNTKNKVFCSCKNIFGEKINTNICEICTAMPGALPKFNKDVEKAAIMAGFALNCQINKQSTFDRKNYFYPDLPKGYQITQKEIPICGKGNLQLLSGKVVHIERIHIEEDAGKIFYENGKVVVDFNRCGVPLLEIVTTPCIDSSKMAYEYCNILQNQIKSIKISDCKMEQGSLRCDVNISLNKKDETALGDKVELKNLNSFSNMVKAIDYEILRQMEILEKGGKVKSQTRKFNIKTGETELMREKEAIYEYKYFPEPNLKKIILNDRKINRIKEQMPQTFLEKVLWLKENFNLSFEKGQKIAKYNNLFQYYKYCLILGCDKDFIYNLIFDVVFSHFKTEKQREEFDININEDDMLALYKLMQLKKVTNSKIKEIVNLTLKQTKQIKDIINDEYFF